MSRVTLTMIKPGLYRHEPSGLTIAQTKVRTGRTFKTVWDWSFPGASGRATTLGAAQTQASRALILEHAINALHSFQ